MDENDRSQNRAQLPAALEAQHTDLRHTDQGFDFDGIEDVRAAVFQTIGAASVCWQSPEGAGVFDSTRAAALGEGLLAWLDTHYAARAG